MCSRSVSHALYTNLVTSRREIFDCREALDFDIFELIGRGVHLGNDDVFVAGKLLTKLIPDRNELFAVPAPRGIYSSNAVVWNV